MVKKDRATNAPPEKPGGEGWLVRPEQQLLCQFKPDSATVHAQWVAVRTYSWVPTRPPALKPVGECFAITPLRRGTRYSKQAGDGACRRCVDPI